MIIKSITFRNLTAVVATCLLAISCSDMTDNGTTLPDGKYPMTFTSSVDGLTVSRATTNADGKTSWKVNDLVAISMDGGAHHKVYKISNTGTGSMVPDDETNTLYWRKSNETKTLAAWYPVSCTVGSNTVSSEVNIADQNASFETLENILHAPAQDYTYSNSNPVAFVFRHALAKVKVTLKKGDGIEDSDLPNATVCLTGYTAGSLEYDGMTGSGNNGDIIPKKETPANGGATTYSALVIPQQMQGKKFIKVTIGADGAARDYYYTPAGTNDANLESGKQYTYTITVKKTGLEVTVTGNGTSWTDESVTTNPDDPVTFHITAPKEGITITAPPGGNLKDNGNGSYTLFGGNTVSITATSTYIQSIKGLYEVAGDGKTYTLKSDLLITEYTLADARVGDFYCKSSDGSTGYLIPGDASLTEAQQKACIGVVLKAGRDADGEWKDDCDYKLKGTDTPMNTIHGYVLALYDANGGGTCQWGSYGTQVDHVDMNREKENGFYGYKNTNAIKAFAKENGISLSSGFPATYYATTDYETREGGKYAAPANSSGWFLPSAGQCWYWFQNKNVLLGNVKRAMGDSDYDWGYWYWSSSETSGRQNYPPNEAWIIYIKSSYGGVGYGTKNDNSSGRVRCSLAF